jgi:uncharacterized membrane protein YqaE (UPF0057 family)
MGEGPAQKHLDRRNAIINKQNKSLTEEVKNNSGILAMTVLYFWDAFVELIFKFFFTTLDISVYAFDYIYNLIFGNFNGIFPSVNKYGSMYTYKSLRYIITIFVPPLGVLMGKGLMGWFNIIICLVICYVNYLAGIVYAFVITANNRYADRYERRNIEAIKAQQAEANMEGYKHKSPFYAGIFFIIFIILIIMMGIYVF